MCWSERQSGLFTQSAPPRNGFLFSFALYFLHHNSHHRVAGEEPTGYYSETSHPRSRSDQTTVLACSTQPRLARPKRAPEAGNVQVHHRGDGLAQTQPGWCQGSPSCTQPRAAPTGNSVHHSTGTQRQEGPKEMITSPCSETSRPPVEMFSSVIKPNENFSEFPSWLERQPQRHVALQPGPWMCRDQT